MSNKMSSSKLFFLSAFIVAGCGGGRGVSNNSGDPNNDPVYPPNSLIYLVRDFGSDALIADRAFNISSKQHQELNLKRQVQGFEKIDRFYKPGYYYYFTYIDDDGSWTVYRNKTLSPKGGIELLKGSGRVPNFTVLGDETKMMYSLVVGGTPEAPISTIRLLDLPTMQESVVMESFDGITLPVGSRQGALFGIKFKPNQSARGDVVRDQEMWIYDGNKLFRLETKGKQVSQHRFSLDGRYLFTIEGQGTRRTLCRYNTFSFSREELTDSNQRIMSIRTSPDSSQIAYTVQTVPETECELFVIPNQVDAEPVSLSKWSDEGTVFLLSWTSDEPSRDIEIDYLLSDD